MVIRDRSAPWDDILSATDVTLEELASSAGDDPTLSSADDIEFSQDSPTNNSLQRPPTPTFHTSAAVPTAVTTQPRQASRRSTF
jgi:hypothetical protein